MRPHRRPEPLEPPPVERLSLFRRGNADMPRRPPPMGIGMIRHKGTARRWGSAPGGSPQKMWSIAPPARPGFLPYGTRAGAHPLPHRETGGYRLVASARRRYPLPMPGSFRSVAAPAWRHPALSAASPANRHLPRVLSALVAATRHQPGHLPAAVRLDSVPCGKAGAVCGGVARRGISFVWAIAHRKPAGTLPPCGEGWGGGAASFERVAHPLRVPLARFAHKLHLPPPSRGRWGRGTVS